MVFALLAGMVVSFLAGGIPFGLAIGKLVRGVDLRKLGSGNIGAANAARVLGYYWGGFIFLLDGLKGFLPVFLLAPLFARWGGREEQDVIFRTLFALSAFLGHVFSPYLRFRGGKGVATAAGVLMALTPQAVLIAFAAWIVVLLIFRIVSVASLAAAAVLPASHLLLRGSRPGRDEQWIFFFCVAIAGIVIFRHGSNIARLLRGEEPRFKTRK